MTKTDLRAYLKEKGISVRTMASYLSIDHKTLHRYLDGARPMPAVVFLAMHSVLPVAWWKLEPIDVAHNDWRCSKHNKPVVISAVSETHARKIAMLRFYKQARRMKNGASAVPRDPWTNSERVNATRLQFDQRSNIVTSL